MRYPVQILVYIIAFFVLIPGIPPNQGAGEREFIPGMPEQIITGPNAGLSHESRILNGNLTIENGGVFTLEQSHLYINSSSSDKFGIHVKPGGTLILRNSTIESHAQYWGYSFVVEGTLRTDNCTISDMYYPGYYEPSGLQIYSNDVLLNDTIISNSGYHSAGLYIFNATPEVRNCEIYAGYISVYVLNDSFPYVFNTTLASHTNGQGLFCKNASFILESCTITNNSWGIYAISGDKVEVRNTTFKKNGVGVALSSEFSMPPIIKGCVFEENTFAALWLTGNATVEDCEFRCNGVPDPFRGISALVISGAWNNTAVEVRNSSFQENHNGILSWNASLELSNCTFENNTLFNGTTGATIYGSPENTEISVEGCTFTDNPIGMDIISENTSANYVF
ncbi:MAG: right-handed parallel beta-helix repeat-containing protein, partial [Thermoplasmata archaeon]|nr:right-handed parallel beta-helix repeat-containing protein [Thermoplasmata archaeon]